MEQSQDRILQMVAAGAITAEEANRLLAAIEGPSAADEAVPAAPLSAADLPRISDFRRGWRWPFVGATFLVALSLSKIAAGRGRRGVISQLGRGFYWLLAAVSAVGALFFLWSRDARWLYIRIDQADGRRFALSLPVPVGVLAGLLRFARRFNSDPDVIAQLDAAEAFLREMQVEMDGPGGQPLTIDINDQDQHVQIYFL